MLDIQGYVTLNQQYAAAVSGLRTLTTTALETSKRAAISAKKALLAARNSAKAAHLAASKDAIEAAKQQLQSLTMQKSPQSRQQLKPQRQLSAQPKQLLKPSECLMLPLSLLAALERKIPNKKAPQSILGALQNLVGRTTGLEPATTRITIWDSTN